MNRIRLLPEQVANQIAAGEVVERPASVVKELVENSLDAQATRMTVEIQAGGRSLVRVTDDGFGMSRDDALLCLERHATSKIRRAEDLAAIATMGFRGEALPSIASVSRFTLTTRERDSDSPEGTQIIINGGKILEVKAAGSAPGTRRSAPALLQPARAPEISAHRGNRGRAHPALPDARRAGVSRSRVHLSKDGRLVWQLPAVKSGSDVAARLAALRERLRALYGDDKSCWRWISRPKCARRTKPRTHASAPSDFGLRTSNFHLWGFIGAPGVSRATREDQHLFVNRRPVENRGLNFALLEGYHTALMKGRYPVCCLFLEIDPAAVDVNIHPAKREVKFHREAEVRRLVAQAVRQTLLAFPCWQARAWKPNACGSNHACVKPLYRQAGQPVRHVEQSALPNFPAGLKPAPTPPPKPSAQQPPLHMGFSPRQPAEPAAARSRSPDDHVTDRLTPVTPPPSGADTRPASPATRPPLPQPPPPIRAIAEPVPLLNVPLRLVGVIGRLYVVLESDRGLVLLDQHAAHERILFEQMLNRLEQHDQAPSQKLLLPETVELSARDASFLREQLPALTRLGVGLSEFGERTFLLDALPPFVKAPDAAPVRARTGGRTQGRRAGG